MCVYTLFLHFLFRLQSSNEVQRSCRSTKQWQIVGHSCPVFWIWGCNPEFPTSQQCLAFYRGNLNRDGVASLLPESLSILLCLHYLSGKRLSEVLMEVFWGTSWTGAWKMNFLLVQLRMDGDFEICLSLTRSHFPEGSSLSVRIITSEMLSLMKHYFHFDNVALD